MVLTHALVERTAWPVWNCVPVLVMMFVKIRFQHKIHQTVIQNNSVCGCMGGSRGWGGGATKKNMKDIINSREFQGDKGPDWLKTFHPRDVPNSSRSYCKICPLLIIQTFEHLVTKKWKKRFPNSSQTD